MAARSPGRRPRILVADDDPDARAATALLLEPDYELVAAVDGEEAVALARAERPDILLLDLVMPRLDGVAALERLRGDPATASLPVVLLSARNDEAIRVQALDLGAEFLQKTPSARELRARLEQLLRAARTQRDLRELARTDPLTGLANLRAFRGRLDEEAKRARRYRTPLTCLMLDLDRLKALNDQLGHATGDRALAAVAAILADELRETDFAARYGGDEFVALLPHTGPAEGLVLAERVCDRVREARLESGEAIVAMGVSIGVASWPESGEATGEELVRAADTALYDAKRAGRGCVRTAALTR